MSYTQLIFMYTWNEILVTPNLNYWLPLFAPIWPMSFRNSIFLMLTLTVSPSFILGYFLSF